MRALFAMGFRPFFLGAGAFAVLSMGAWAVVYGFAVAPPLDGIAPSAWHAHEMLYGYAMAVIAGFLLTAVRNWTGLPTPTGPALAALFGLWALARLQLLAGSRFMTGAAVADLLFASCLLLAVAMPIVRKRQWRQSAVLSKLLLLGTGNAAFYAGALGWLEDGVRWGLYGGFYLVIALILTMGRRLIPLFTERGVQPNVSLRNLRILDLSSLALLLAFWVAEVFLQARAVAGVCAAGVFAVNAVRIALWYTPGIWRNPLLWCLHLAFALIAAGFLLLALAAAGLFPANLAVHTLAIGGVGLVTLGMMARVSLGHTGRSVHQPPRLLQLPLALLLLALLARVGGPLLLPGAYTAWVLASQTCWILAFAIFTVAWLPLLTGPRVDGAPG